MTYKIPFAGTIAAIALLSAVGARAADRIEIPLWFHGGAGQEHETLAAMVADFNASQSKYTAVVTEIPGGGVAGSGYGDAVNAAAVAGQLPCVLDLDGPNLYNYAWANYLKPLDEHISPDFKADYLSTLLNQGTYNGHVYALAMYDSGLGIATRRSTLAAANIRIPTISKPWTKDEFDAAVKAVAKLPGIASSLDLKMNWGAGEFLTQELYPIAKSFGGDLIDQRTFSTADGFINSPETVAALTYLQSLAKAGYIDMSPPDDNDFVNGKVGMAIFGSWMYVPYKAAFKDDLIILPMPNFGKGVFTSMGSWQWAITSTCKHPDGAWDLINYFISADQMLRYTATNSCPPGRTTARLRMPIYAKGGDLDVLWQQLVGGIAIPRPKTPAYPTITAAFYAAADNILKGADVQSSLDTAADKIDQNIKENNGYPAK